MFLGLHLLVTDPSTSPRTPLGKTVFGVLYGLGVFGLYALLEALGAPTFYDKLLCVPLLNLSVQRIDRVVHAVGDSPVVSRWRSDWTPMNRSGCRRALQPEHPVLAIHMGGSGAGYPEADELYRQARELGLRRSNIRYVLSAKRDTHIESDLIAYTQAGEPFCRNLSCASDAPYGRMTWNFGGFRAMFRSLQDGAHHTDPRVREHPGLFTQEIVRGYLGRNLAELVIHGYQELLRIQKAE